MNNGFPIGKFFIILSLMFIGIILINKACTDNDEKQVAHTTMKEREAKEPIYKLSEEEIIIKNPASYLKLTPKSWYLGGFGVISMQNFDIENMTNIDMKDVSIKFTYFSESKTILSTSTETVYKTIRAKSKTKVREFNAGFVNQQTASCQLEIVNAVPIVIYK